MIVRLDAPPLPCRGQHRVYDLAQHTPAGTDPDLVVWARREAARLCGGCPSPCSEQVTTPPPTPRRAHRKVRVRPARADDPDVLASVLAGHLPSRPLSVAEKRYLVLLLHAQGFNDRIIAARLGCSVTPVWTARTSLGLPAHRHHG